MDALHAELQQLLRDFLAKDPEGIRKIANEFSVSRPTVS